MPDFILFFIAIVSFAISVAALLPPSPYESPTPLSIKILFPCITFFLASWFGIYLVQEQRWHEVVESKVHIVDNVAYFKEGDELQNANKELGRQLEDSDIVTIKKSKPGFYVGVYSTVDKTEYGVK